MAKCDQIHREYDRYANKDVQSGELPGWMHVTGTVCWYVYQGPYSGLANGWPMFMGKANARFPGRLDGPPGDVYVCDPADHTEAGEARLTTILWCPMKP